MGSHPAELTGAAAVPGRLRAPQRRGVQPAAGACTQGERKTGSAGGPGGCEGTGGSPRAPHSGGSSSQRTPPSSEGAESGCRGKGACAGVWGSSHPTHLKRSLMLFIVVVSL